MPERNFRCAVTEGGAPCKEGFIAVYPNRALYEEAEGSRWICLEHRKRGYEWFSVITSDPSIDSHLVRTERPGERTGQLKANPQGFITGLKGWGLVQAFDDDALMLRLEEAKSPGDPVVERRVKVVVPGFARPD